MFKRVTSKMFMLRAHPSLFVNYVGLIAAALGTGAASVMADPLASTPILGTFYQWAPIRVWGWIYLGTGIVLLVGLFNYWATRIGLWIALSLLLLRLSLQVWQGYIFLRDGEAWTETLPKVAGLPLLLGLVMGVYSMTMSPFTNPDDSPDVDVVRVPNGNGEK